MDNILNIIDSDPSFIVGGVSVGVVSAVVSLLSIITNDSTFTSKTT